MKTEKELQSELLKLNRTEKLMDIEDKVKAKRRELIKRKYRGIQKIFLFDIWIFGFAMLLGKFYSYGWLVFFLLVYLWVGVICLIIK